MPPRALIASVAAVCALGCRDRASCLDVPKQDPSAVIARCTAEYQRTHDPRVAVAVVAAHVARKEDDAVLAWADSVGDAPGTALIWRRAAQVHERRGERAAMLVAGQRALELWEKAGANGEAAYEARVLSTVYRASSQWLPALAAARRGRGLALASDDQEMRRDTFGDLFSILEQIGDQAAASAVFDEARRTTPDGDTRARYYLSYYEGLLRFHERRFELARLADREALTFPAAVRDPGIDRAVLYNLVEIEVLLGELDAAERDLAAAVTTLPENPPVYMRSARAFFTGLCARARRQPARAEAVVREAMAASPPVDWVLQLEHLLGAALEDEGRRDEAIAAYRRAIAKVEQMRGELGIIDVLQLHLRERKRAPYEAVFELEATSGHRDAAMAVAELLWRRGFVESFASPAEPGDTADPAAERIRGVSAVLPQLARDTAPADPSAGPQHDLLAFIEARGALWRYSRLETQVKLERLPISSQEAAKLVAALRARVDDRAVAGQLGALLIPRSATAATHNDDPLAIVADGVLSGLPFAALRVDGRWLVERRALAYQPGLDPAGPSPAAKPALDPQAPSAVVLAATGAPGAPPLPAALREATEVGRALGVAPLLGEQANLAALRRAGRVGLLHLAAHGGIAPGGAFIRLSDGDVTVSDVARLGLAPRVVVLASCASGARSGGSLWGAMGGAFLAAGSRAVIATLWSVEDAATALIIREFYAAHGDRHPHTALATAQRKAIAAGVAPGQWAAFVALGEPDRERVPR